MKTPTTNHLLEDITEAAKRLSVADNLIAIESAEKVRKHLLKSIEKGNRYHRKNLNLVDSMIQIHRNTIENELTESRQASM